MPYMIYNNFSAAQLALEAQQPEKKVATTRTANLVSSVLIDKPQLFTSITKEDLNFKFNLNETILAKNIKDFIPEKFGVLEHIDLNRSFLVDAVAGILDLRNQFFNEKDSGLKSLYDRVSQLVTELKALAINSEPYNFAFINALKDPTRVVAEVGDIKVTKEKPVTAIDSETNASELYPTALFSAGNSLRSDIRLVDQLHELLMRIIKDINAELVRKRNELNKLEEEIPIDQRNLANLNQQRIKAMGEYQMVVSLVAEDWARVEQEYIRRERILTNHSGLYFVRVQETPFNRLSVVDRSLRYGRIEDLVPATAISQDELPEDLEDYIEAIVDIPIANWKVFENSWHLLPAPNTINKLLEQRKLRLTYLSQKNRKASSSKFVPILQVHQALLQDYARFDFFQEISLQAFNRRAADILSLEDLLGGAPHQLRGKAQNFRNQLDQATHALLAKLQNIKPGIRMAWATAAEVDQLDLQNPHLWPNLREEQDEDIDNIRSLFELINWWWRQLAPNASSAAVTALRNLLRATLMVAVGDDPKEMLHGFLQAIPAQFKLGDLLRAKLNRHAPIGTQLQLVNEKNELIGKLRVEDADDNGSLVSLTQLIKQDVIHSSAQFTVVGIKTQGRSFV